MKHNVRREVNKFPVVDENGDYIWRFKLELAKDNDSSEKGLTEFFRSQLNELLKVIILTEDGNRIRPNGFKFINDLQKEHKIW